MINSQYRCSNLLRLQSQLDKDLLQLLVDKVDAELLEAVPLPGEKTVQAESDLPLTEPKLPLPSVVFNVQHAILVSASESAGSVGWTRTHLKYLESINVKNPDAEFFVWFLDCFIYGLKETEGEHVMHVGLHQFMSVSLLDSNDTYMVHGYDCRKKVVELFP